MKPASRPAPSLPGISMRWVVYGGLLIILLLGSGCTHRYYVPNTVHIPMLKENQGRVALGMSVGEEYKAVEVQSAFAVGRHFGLMCNYIGGDGRGLDILSGDRGSGDGRMIELGAGFMKPLGSSGFQFEQYAGWGSGRVRNQYDAAEQAHLHLTRWFIQPSLGYSFDIIEAGLASRFSRVTYDIRSSNVTEGNNYYDWVDIEAIRKDPVLIVWEPGVVVRVGFEQFKFEFHTTFAYPIRDAGYEIARYNLGFGAIMIVDYHNFQTQ